MNIKKYISILFLILATSITTAQVTFEAKVSKNKLGINERLRIEITMNVDVDTFVPPSFVDFNVIGNPAQSTSNSFVDGEYSYSKTISYTVSMKQKGIFNISSATLIFKEKEYKTEPIRIEVVEKRENVLTAEDKLNSKFNEGVHFIAIPSDSIITLKDSLTIKYKLYVSQDVGISKFEPLKDLKNVNFEVEQMKASDMEIKYETYKNVKYRYIILRTSVLKPKEKGTYDFEGIELDITAEIPSEEKDIFGKLILEKMNTTIKANNVIINVI